MTHPAAPDAATARAAVPGLAELAVVTRSGLIESRHYGTLAVIDPSGELVLSCGDPEATILPRSTVKPAQAVACLAAGAPLEGAQLAIAAGSHTGQDEHVATVRAILAEAGLTEDALQCPPDRPEDEPTFAGLAAAGNPRSRIRMNCSGKHAAMLLTCAVNGWSVGDYLDHDHPLQQRVRSTVADLTGGPVTYDAVDGCGAPLFGTSVRGMAHAFHRLVQADTDSAAGTVARAMRQHPFYVGGSGHANTRVMELLPGVLSKGGAEGVIGMAAADGTAVSMKIIDGNPRATTVLALAALRAAGTDVTAADEEMNVDILGGGVPVGDIRVGSDLGEALDRLQARR